MDVSVLIPWRSDHGPREEVWRWLEPQWLATGAEIITAEDATEGPFNFSRACNRAFSAASHTNLLIFGADQIPDIGVMQSAASRLNSEPWFPLFEQTTYYSKDSSARIMSGKPCHDEPFEHVVPFCTGVLAVSSLAYKASGGMDERFSGWGMEDSAFRRTLFNLYGDRWAFPASLRCLWHPEGERGRSSENNWKLIREYEALNGYLDTKQYLAERGSFL
jgi:hypothetical protein